MRLAFTIPVVVLLAAAGAMAQPADDPAAKLGRALEGRTAGKPVSCISLTRSPRSSIVGDAIIYKESRGRWYVNRPDGGQCPLAANRTIISSTPTTRLCSGDIMTIVDMVTRFGYGSCGLGQFVPYTRDRR